MSLRAALAAVEPGDAARERAGLAGRSQGSCLSGRLDHRVGERGLQFLMNVLGSANEPNAGHAETVSVERFFRGGDR